jgi:hypothetical protein
MSLPRLHNLYAALLRRYRELEAEAEAEAARYIQQAAEAGQQGEPGAMAEPVEQPNLVPLGLEAGCRYARSPCEDSLVLTR